MQKWKGAAAGVGMRPERVELPLVQLPDRPARQDRAAFHLGQCEGCGERHGEGRTPPCAPGMLPGSADRRQTTIFLFSAAMRAAISLNSCSVLGSAVNERRVAFPSRGTPSASRPIGLFWPLLKPIDLDAGFSCSLGWRMGVLLPRALTGWR